MTMQKKELSLNDARRWFHGEELETLKSWCVSELKDDGAWSDAVERHVQLRDRMFRFCDSHFSAVRKSKEPYRLCLHILAEIFIKGSFQIP